MNNRTSNFRFIHGLLPIFIVGRGTIVYSASMLRSKAKDTKEQERISWCFYQSITVNLGPSLLVLNISNRVGDVKRERLFHVALKRSIK